MKQTLKISMATLVITLAGCGGAKPEAKTSAEPAAQATEAQPATQAASTESAAPGALPEKWSEDMSDEQKAAFMKQKVSPHMSEVFQGFDGARYAEFSCKTCHGPNYQDPKDFLPRLTLKDGKLTCFADAPDVSKFMAMTVAPEMAKALGLPPFNPETHEGFGCAGCHAIDVR